MKVAHLILAHNHPIQLERLVKRLVHNNSDIYIHLDAKTDIQDYQHLAALKNTCFIVKRTNVVWCEYSTIAATLTSMHEILQSEVTYSHINLLSGNDYPLQKTEDMMQFFLSHEKNSYLWFDKIFNDWPDGQARVKHHYYGDYGFPGRYHITPLLNKVLGERKLPNGMVAYGRSQWLTITPECARYVIDFTNDHTAIKRFFRQTWAVDEVFFQTILCNSELRGTLVNDNLRHIELNEAYRPKTFTIADKETLLHSPKFFARKFDMSVDALILDELDAKSMAE